MSEYLEENEVKFVIRNAQCDEENYHCNDCPLVDLCINEALMKACDNIYADNYDYEEN